MLLVNRKISEGKYQKILFMFYPSMHQENHKCMAACEGMANCDRNDGCGTILPQFWSPDKLSHMHPITYHWQLLVLCNRWFSRNITCPSSTNLFATTTIIHCNHLCCVTFATNNHHPSQPSFNHMQPPLHIPTTMTTWQHHITESSAYAVLMAYIEDDLAHQQTLSRLWQHVVFTIHIPFFTQETGDITTHNR